MGDVLSINGAHVRLGGAMVLEDVDLHLGPGEAIGIAGPNGSGKSTLLRLAAGLIRPSLGTVAVLGADPAGVEADAIRSRIGLIGHAPLVHPRLTLGEHLELVETMIGATSGAGADALETVGLGEVRDRRAVTCSNGMLRRAEFARLLVTAPDLLLLDEADAGLDASAAPLLDHLLSTTLERGGAALVVSHGTFSPSIDDARRLIDGRLPP